MTNKPTYEELQAQVEVLKGADAILCAIAEGCAENPVLVAKGYVKGFGAACIAQVRAEAVEVAANKLRFAPISGGHRWAVRHSDLMEHAERIRQGGTS